MRTSAGLLILRIVKAAVLIALFVLLITWVTMGLWNFVMPAVFNLPAITWMQAAALLLLTRILIGGGHYGWNRVRDKWQYKMGSQLNKQWADMSEAEKEQVKRYWKHKCSVGFSRGFAKEETDANPDSDKINS